MFLLCSFAAADGLMVFAIAVVTFLLFASNLFYEVGDAFFGLCQDACALVGYGIAGFDYASSGLAKDPAACFCCRSSNGKRQSK